MSSAARRRFTILMVCGSSACSPHVRANTLTSLVRGDAACSAPASRSLRRSPRLLVSLTRRTMTMRQYALNESAIHRIRTGTAANYDWSRKVNPSLRSSSSRIHRVMPVGRALFLQRAEACSLLPSLTPAYICPVYYTLMLALKAPFSEPARNPCLTKLFPISPSIVSLP